MTYFGYFVPVFRQKGKKIVHTSLILNKFSFDKMQIPCFPKQQTNIEVSCVMPCIFLHNLEQRLSVFARGCVETVAFS